MRFTIPAPRTVGLACLLALALGARATAQDTPTTTTPPTTLPAEDDTVGFETPRSAIRGFLAATSDGDWDGAATYLDLRDRPKTPPVMLARELKTVLDRKLVLDIDALGRTPEGEPSDNLPASRDQFGAIKTATGTVKLYVERVPAPDGTRQWKIARATVAQIPKLYAEFGDGPLATVLPDPFFDIRFLDVQLWQWLGLLTTLLGAAIVAFVFTWPLVRLVRFFARRASAVVDDQVIPVIVGPLRLGLAIVLFAAVRPALRLPLAAQSVLGGLETVAMVVAVTWLLMRLADAGRRILEQRLVARGQAPSVALIPLAERVVKVLILILAVLAALQNVGFNATGVLAGLGVGGLAVALAAQKSLENLFGGLSLIADQPVRVGDFCRFGTNTGTVEDIGLRSTRVRTLDRTLITIPNAEFATLQLENFAARDRMRLTCTLGLRYETTPDQLRFLLIELKKLLLSHPKISPDPARVRLVGFGQSSLDVELFAFVMTRDADDFLAIREDLFLRILDLVAACGTGFAFPSQTVYEANDGIDAERQKAAEAAVARWRAEGRLPLPTVPRDEATAIAGTLDWPPQGSAERRREEP